MCRPSGCRLIRVHHSPLVTRSTIPHSQIAVASSPQRPASQCALAQGSPSSSSRVVPHHHPKVALALGEQSVGVDELERVAAGT